MLMDISAPFREVENSATVPALLRQAPAGDIGAGGHRAAA
jgi:hypothetical protein